jgi:Fic family protein
MAFVPDPLPPTLDAPGQFRRLVAMHDEARKQLLKLEMRLESLPGRARLFAAMQTKEAQASSRIEDTVASVQELVVADMGLFENPETTMRSDPMDVLRNRRAIQHGLASELGVTSRLLKEMHEILIVDSNHRPGEFRDRQVYIGEKSRGFTQAKFVPPPGEMVADLMAGWEKFSNPGSIQSPAREWMPYYVDLALAHYQFEAIHPFSDGNGRLGRAMVTIAPIKHGELRLPVCNLSEWIQTHREEYNTKLLRVSAHGEWEEWIRFFCLAIGGQAQNDLRRAERINALYDNYYKAVLDVSTSTNALKLLDLCFDRLGFTIPQAAKALDVTYPPAKLMIDKFLSLGILVPMDVNEKYGKVFLAEKVIAAFEKSEME